MLGDMKRSLYLAIGSLGLLAACDSGDVRDVVGLDRSAPDEFRVVSRPPLSVPPDFDLRPPAPGEEPRAAPSTEKQAKKLVFGDEGNGSSPATLFEEPASDTAVPAVMSSELSSSAESNFLKKLGTDKADPDIRNVIHEENKAEPVVKDDVSPLESMLGISSGDPVIDAKEEAKRIKTNKEKGKPVNAGKSKVIDPKKQSVLDRIMD